MNWEQLGKFIGALSDEQKNTDVTICLRYKEAEAEAEYFRVRKAEVTGETDVLDSGHPCLVVETDNV